MPKVRMTLNVDPDVLRALTNRAARSHKSTEEVVDEVLRHALGLDVEDPSWKERDAAFAQPQPAPPAPAPAVPVPPARTTPPPPRAATPPPAPEPPARTPAGPAPARHVIRTELHVDPEADVDRDSVPITIEHSPNRGGRR